MRWIVLPLFVGCSAAPIETPPPLADADAPDVKVVEDAAVESSPPDDAAREADAAPIPSIDAIPWNTGAAVGYGVASKDTMNPLGDSILLAYGGYDVTLSGAEDWATALYKATAESRGVRYVWAIQGPADPTYSGFEIGNSHIASAMVPLVSSATKFILVLAHSSGSYVAHELLEQLASGADPSDVTKDKLVYFDLDGGGGLSQAAIDRLRNLYFVGSHDGTTLSPNHAGMESLGATYASKGGFWDNDASGSGCDAGAIWCVHVTLINTRPHDPTTGSALLDYSDFVSRPVCTSYISAKAAQAGL